MLIGHLVLYFGLAVWLSKILKGLRKLGEPSLTAPFLPSGVKLPVLAALEEVNLVVAAPDEGSVHVVRHPGETLRDGLGVARCWLAVGELPVPGVPEHQHHND